MSSARSGRRSSDEALAPPPAARHRIVRVQRPRLRFRSSREPPGRSVAAQLRHWGHVAELAAPAAALLLASEHATRDGRLHTGLRSMPLLPRTASTACRLGTGPGMVGPPMRALVGRRSVTSAAEPMHIQPMLRLIAEKVVGIEAATLATLVTHRGPHNHRLTESDSDRRPRLHSDGEHRFDPSLIRRLSRLTVLTRGIACLRLSIPLRRSVFGIPRPNAFRLRSVVRSPLRPTLAGGLILGTGTSSCFSLGFWRKVELRPSHQADCNTTADSGKEGDAL